MEERESGSDRGEPFSHLENPYDTHLIHGEP